jgi:hypothetical protein
VVPAVHPPQRANADGSDLAGQPLGSDRKDCAGEGRREQADRADDAEAADVQPADLQQHRGHRRDDDQTCRGDRSPGQ